MYLIKTPQLTKVMSAIVFTGVDSIDFDWFFFGFKLQTEINLSVQLSQGCLLLEYVPL